MACANENQSNFIVINATRNVLFHWTLYEIPSLSFNDKKTRTRGGTTEYFRWAEVLDSEIPTTAKLRLPPWGIYIVKKIHKKGNCFKNNKNRKQKKSHPPPSPSSIIKSVITSIPGSTIFGYRGFRACFCESLEERGRERKRERDMQGSWTVVV